MDLPGPSHSSTSVADRDRSSLVSRSQQRAIEQFRRAAKTVPFYTRLLASHGIRPAEVRDIETFRAVVPIIGKRDVFASNALADLLADRTLDSIATIVSSSGSTAQSFSLGMLHRNSMRSLVRSVDRLLDVWFQIRRKKTFVINSCAMGVTIPTSLPGISLSVRSDTVLALLQALKPYYQQFLITSDVYFLKKILEDGRSAGLRWNDWPVQFAMGGEWYPESYRQYLAALLQVDLSAPHPPIHILGSMGAAELGFNLCFETHDTVRLRQLAASDASLCQALFGSVDTVPIIGHYDPRRWLIELTPTRELGSNGGAFVFTTVDLDAAMPMVRYRTGDCGYILPYSHVRRVLRDFKYDAYIPSSTLPLLAVAGRTDQSVTVAGKTIRMEFLRSLLYSNHRLATATTGQFRVATRGGRLHLRIQLQAALASERRASIQARFSALFNRHVPAVVQAVPYFDFRDALSVDYERKFHHRVREP